MTNLITGIIGIAGVLTFLGILLWWIKAVPLIIICLLVMALMIFCPSGLLGLADRLLTPRARGAMAQPAAPGSAPRQEPAR